jgi:hypothetical protein
MATAALPRSGMLGLPCRFSGTGVPGRYGCGRVLNSRFLPSIDGDLADIEEMS